MKNTTVELVWRIRNNERYPMTYQLGDILAPIFVDFVKTPAVKPCIVYIIDLPDSVGSKQCQQLSGYLPPLLL